MLFTRKLQKFQSSLFDYASGYIMIAGLPAIQCPSYFTFVARQFPHVSKPLYLRDMCCIHIISRWAVTIHAKNWCGNHAFVFYAWPHNNWRHWTNFIPFLVIFSVYGCIMFVTYRRIHLARVLWPRVTVSNSTQGLAKQFFESPEFRSIRVFSWFFSRCFYG